MSPLAIIAIRREPAYRRDAFESGLKRLGYRVLLSSTTAGLRPYSRDDLFITWNLKRGHDEKAAANWEACGGTVLVVENGYLAKTEKTHYAISTRGHCGSGWSPVGAEDRFTTLGFELMPMNYDREGYPLVCGQRGVGSSLMASPPRWGEAMARSIPGSRFRPHPGQLAPRTTLADDLRGASKVVVWSSAVGVRALVEGIPVVHHAPHWICSGWERDREGTLNRMAHAQWSVSEIGSSEPFARMRETDWAKT